MSTKVSEIYKDLLAFVEEGDKPVKEDYGTDQTHFQEDLRAYNERTANNQTQRLFYNAVRYLLQRDYAFPDKALIPPADDNGGEPTENLLDNLPNNSARAEFLAVAGLLLAEGYKDPTLGKNKRQLTAPGDICDNLDKAPKPKACQEVLIAAGFVGRVVEAVKEYKTNADLFSAIHLRLLKASTITVGDKSTASFGARQLAEITRQLLADGITANDSQLGPRFDRALATSLSGAIEGRSSAIDVDLPDLEEGTEADIIVDNVKALSAVYFSAMLEELKFFLVMDKVVEQFQTGMLPVSRGKGGDRLYDYIRSAHQRMTEVDRRELYARSFGLAQGSVEEAMPNRDFNDVWIRFLSAVSFNNREKDSMERKLTSDEQVFKSGRDLAVNLSLHGYGMAHFAAVELQNQIKFIKDTLSARDILQAYGVRDIWQLIERCSANYLGGQVNSVRQRTMAQAGSKIIQWLANQAGNLTGSGQRLFLDAEIRAYAERWLAVTGTPDSAVERYSEPVALQQQRTIPDFGQIAGGSALRDALSKIGDMGNLAGIAPAPQA